LEACGLAPFVPVAEEVVLDSLLETLLGVIHGHGVTMPPLLILLGAFFCDGGRQLAVNLT
jgi:hypothetical protein